MYLLLMAQPPGGAQSNPIAAFLPLIVLVAILAVIFYFMVIRSHQKGAKEHGNTQNRAMIFFGVILIMAAVLALVGAPQVYDKAQSAAMFESGAKAHEMVVLADLIHYGGFAAGAIGSVLLLAGLLKKSDK